MSDTEIVKLEIPKNLEMIPTTYDDEKLLKNLVGIELDFKDKDGQVIPFNAYKAAIDLVVDQFKNVVMTDENEKEFTETRTGLNKSLEALKGIAKDVKNKVNARITETLEPLNTSISNLDTLITDTFTEQINARTEKKRDEKMNDLVNKHLDAYIEVHGNALGIKKEQIEALFETKKTDRTTWQQYLTNSTTTEKQIVSALELLGQQIVHEKEKETLKKQKASINITKAEELIKLIKKDTNVDIAISDMDITITAETSEEMIKASLKKAYNAKQKAKEAVEPKQEVPTIKTGQHDLTFLVPDDLLNLFTFAVGFRTTDEQMEFTNYMLKFPGFSDMFVKDLDTFFLGGKK